MGCFAYFLQILVMSKDMAYSPELEAFLSYPDIKKAKENSKLLYRVLPNPADFATKPNTPEIKEILTPSGEIFVSMDPRIRKKTRGLSHLMETVEPLEKEASKLCKTITEQMDKMSQSLKQLSIVSEKMGKAYKKAQVEEVSSIYDGLRDAFKSWSDVIDKDSTNFFSNIRLMFLVSRQEEAGLNVTIQERNQFSEEYKIKKSSLVSKKEKLYPTMSLKAWEIDQDQIPVSIQQILQSKELAIKYMLPKVNNKILLQETRNCNNMKDAWGYFNAMIDDQSKLCMALKAKRMKLQLTRFIQTFNGSINSSLTLFIDLSTRLMMMNLGHG